MLRQAAKTPTLVVSLNIMDSCVNSQMTFFAALNIRHGKDGKHRQKKGGVGSPNGIRTRVSALRGLRPKPLDDGAKLTRNYQAIIKEIRFQRIRSESMKKPDAVSLGF